MDQEAQVQPGAQARSGAKSLIVVLGNEKGGSGKSTTAMHLAVALLRQGKRVGTIDLDARQGTFSRLIENRESFSAESDAKALTNLSISGVRARGNRGRGAAVV
jgi:chromosome partitioning protein